MSATTGTGYTAGQAYALRWLETDHRPVGNTARAYAALSRARAIGYRDNRYLAAFCLGVARCLRANAHVDGF